MRHILLPLVLALAALLETEGFAPITSSPPSPSPSRAESMHYRNAKDPTSRHGSSSSAFSSASVPVNGDELLNANNDIDENIQQELQQQQQQQQQRRQKLKRDMLQLGASYDRGFGATSRALEEAQTVIGTLEALNPEKDAARGIDGGDYSSLSSLSPLQGNWRMVWTTASDVLGLGANPLIAVGAVYQVFDPPVVTNVIDLLPRIQNLLPIPNFPSTSSDGTVQQRRRPDSVLRAEVTTRASSRISKPMRVGLIFESVKLVPVELLGNTAVADFLPPLSFDLPRLPDQLVQSLSSAIASTGGDSDVGFFDVTYLDDELLIIRQNAPGGLFVLTKVDSNDP